MKTFKWIMLVVAVLVNAFIIVNACINGTISAQESGGVSAFIASIINFFSPNYINDSNFENFSYVIRKLIGHFALFGFDGVVSTLTFFLFMKDTKLKSPFWLIGFSLGFGFIIAAISEIIQIFTPDRYGTFADIFIDFGGYSLGGALLFCVLIFANFVTFEKASE